MSGQTIYFRITDEAVRERCIRRLWTVPIGWVIRGGPATRTLAQNSRFHAICEDLARSPLEFRGKRRSKDEWKVLLVSGHAVATTNEDPVLVHGLEGEMVCLRESTAAMDKGRSSSLIEYAIAYCVNEGVELRDGIEDQGPAS